MIYAILRTAGDHVWVEFRSRPLATLLKWVNSFCLPPLLIRHMPDLSFATSVDLVDSSQELMLVTSMYNVNISSVSYLNSPGERNYQLQKRIGLHTQSSKHCLTTLRRFLKTLLLSWTTSTKSTTHILIGTCFGLYFRKAIW
jgi:hypothetical protein